MTEAKEAGILLNGDQCSVRYGIVRGNGGSALSNCYIQPINGRNDRSEGRLKIGEISVRSISVINVEKDWN